MTGNVQAVSLVGGTVADKYRLLRVLGIGGMGVVYEAQHAVTHRHVAVKMLHSWVLESSPQAAARFLREAQASASIGHPAIVDVLDAGQLPDGSLYLVFEMLDGLDLENAIATDEIRTQDIVAIAIDVLEGLDAAHARGFVHRDIKPANVFLAKDHAGNRQVKLLDFGIAKRVDASASFTGITAHGSIVGTLEYMSPEQASAAVVDGRTDLWGLGALLFRALAGRAPFLGASQLETVKAILCAPVPSLAAERPDLPYALISIVDRALTRDREQRWPTATAMRDALLAIDCSTLPETLPRQIEESGQTPNTPEDRPYQNYAANSPEDRPYQNYAANTHDRPYQDFAANEPTHLTPMPLSQVTDVREEPTSRIPDIREEPTSRVPDIREEPTKIARERDVVTVRVRDPDPDPQIRVIGIDPAEVDLHARVPVIDSSLDNPITKIVLDQSLLNDSIIHRRSSGGRWTFISLAFLTAIAAGGWVFFSNNNAESEPRVELVQTVEPKQAVEPEPAIVEPPPPPVVREPVVKEEPRIVVEKKEKRRPRPKRTSKRPEKQPIEVKDPPPPPPPAEPAKKTEEELFFYKEDHL